MCDMYSKALPVFVYLGSAQQDSDLAMTSVAGLRAGDKGAAATLKNLRNIIHVRDNYNAANRIMPKTLLSMARGRECKELVDYLWSVMALMSPAVRDGIRSVGRIDYTTTGKREFWRPYIKFARWFIEVDRTLSLLSATRSVSKPPDLPSWCPNWASTQKISALIDIKFYCSGYGSVESRHPLITTDPNSDRILVPGFRIDTVDQIFEDSLAAWAVLSLIIPCE